MGSIYDIELDRKLGLPTLPNPRDLLQDQRAAVAALRVLYPGIKVRLFGVRDKDPKQVRRELLV